MNWTFWRTQPVVYLCLGLFLFAGIIFFHTPHHVVVTLTARGFVPQKIFLHKGDSITFTNQSGSQFWPASDFHPSHLLYPEFDPKRPLGSGEEWTFAFDKAGVWGFHDHLHSQFKGTVIVEGFPGESTHVCLSLFASTTNLSPVCWEGEITDTLQQKGLAAAFDTFKKLYEQDPLFARNCHDVTHVLGTAAFKQFSSNHNVIDLPETSYCGYGFYHGFMEALLLAEGPSQYGDARAYCATLAQNKDGNRSDAACVHGVGHALFDSVDGSLWGDPHAMSVRALAQCEVIFADPNSRVGCADGVFNSFANAMSAQDYNLSYATFVLTNFCYAQKVAYQQRCFGELGIGYIREKNMDRPQALQFIKNLGSTMASYELFVYVADEVKRTISNPDFDSLHTLCVSFTGTDRDECQHGVVEGVLEESGPTPSYGVMFSFCNTFSAEQGRSYCYIKAVSITRSLYHGQPAYVQACKEVAGVNFQNSCQ